MKLSQNLEGRNVKITCVDVGGCSGKKRDYVFPEDNEPEGVAAIDIDNCPQSSGESVSFNEDEIANIEVIN